MQISSFDLNEYSMEIFLANQNLLSVDKTTCLTGEYNGISDMTITPLNNINVVARHTTAPSDQINFILY